ncbi:MAG: helix-turn-helix domain-containing protein [Sedimentisphaeraceae bacterium JB056]
MEHGISNKEQGARQALEEQSAPAMKLLDVLEYFTLYSGSSSLVEISKQTGIPKATLLRILNTLTARGYVCKDADKRYSPLFNLAKASSLPASLEPILADSLQNLISAGCDSAEIILLRESDIFWHAKVEQQQIQLRINAKPGWRRTIYELDAPSRLFLAYIGREGVEACFDTSKFYDTSYRPCTWQKSVEMFSAENIDGVSYDKTGNSNGVRRFATLLIASNVPFIVSVAEAAISKNNTDEHIAKIAEILIKERKRISRCISKEKLL